MKVYSVRSDVYGRPRLRDDAVYFENRDDAIMHAGYLYHKLKRKDRSGFVSVREHKLFDDFSAFYGFSEVKPDGLEEPGVETYFAEYIDANDSEDMFYAGLAGTETEANTIF